jgi:hypothetical protein
MGKCIPVLLASVQVPFPPQLAHTNSLPEEVPGYQEMLLISPRLSFDMLRAGGYFSPISAILKEGKTQRKWMTIM